MVSVCDDDLIGKTISQGDLKVHISKAYFGNEVVTEENALDLVSKCTVANLVGQRIVDLMLDNGLASKEAVKVIDAVPFLMIYKF